MDRSTSVIFDLTVAAIGLSAITGLSSCASSTRAETAPSKDATSATSDASSLSAPSPVLAAEQKLEAKTSDPTPTTASPKAGAPTASVSVRVKIVTVGMHVAGGPFDEPTKEPFKKAVEPHFPEIAQCWGKHVPHPPKQVDVGVDLLIEAGGGHPKVSNPRSTLVKEPEVQEFVPCVIAVFESVEFAKLVDRGRTGVSYSLRFSVQ